MAKAVLAATVLTAATFMAGTTLAKEVTLTAVTGIDATNPLSKSFLENYLAPLNAQCKGKVQMRYVGGQEVVPPENAGKAIQRGQFDLLHSPASYYIGQFPEGYGMLASNVSIPDMHKNGGFQLLDTILNKKMGAKFVAWGENNIGYYTYLMEVPKTDAKGVPDLRGLKLRATGTYRPLFNALGASTINMRQSEIYTALERGVVNGFGTPTTDLPSIGLHKITKVWIEPAFYRLNTIVTMNRAKWDSLDAEQKACMERTARAYEKNSNEYMAKIEKDAREGMLQAGMKPMTLTGAAAAGYLKAAYESIWAELDKRSEHADQLRAVLYNASGS